MNSIKLTSEHRYKAMVFFFLTFLSIFLSCKKQEPTHQQTVTIGLPGGTISASKGGSKGKVSNVMDDCYYYLGSITIFVSGTSQWAVDAATKDFKTEWNARNNIRFYSREAVEDEIDLIKAQIPSWEWSYDVMIDIVNESQAVGRYCEFNGGGGGGGGIGGPSTPPAGYEPNGPTEIKDSVLNTCLKSGLNRSLTAGTTIKNMLNQTFGGTGYTSKDITFYDVNNLADTIMGVCRGYNAYVFEIALNKNKLPDMSEQYIVSTIYHEILHAYIEATYTRNADGKLILPIGNGHNEMADNYIALLTGALKVAFPGISDEMAWGLSWGGLEETTYFKYKLTAQEQEQVKQVNQNSRKTAPSGSRIGTYCP
ncbi:hypothetical protein ABIE26_005342 [Pedobacter africanus]|uniref:Uncharacterized protein n=1 Tax=Pedobacter africanus TaxID=151894 RepID=A0ACC6L4R0_9SPHI|nr:hypothetical protein [Pedobacter africanus]MDR6786471.1 hypothetical protein [Pedobacter africanus]